MCASSQELRTYIHGRAPGAIINSSIRRVRCAHRGRQGVVWPREDHVQHAFIVFLRPLYDNPVPLCLVLGRKPPQT